MRDIMSRGLKGLKVELHYYSSVLLYLILLVHQSRVGAQLPMDVLLKPHFQPAHITRLTAPQEGVIKHKSGLPQRQVHPMLRLLNLTSSLVNHISLRAYQAIPLEKRCGQGVGHASQYSDSIPCCLYMNIRVRH